MLNPVNPNYRDFTKYDNMTTEELDELLNAYFLFPDEIKDKRLIVHILEVLTERDKEIIDENISDPNPSWKKFLKNHPSIAESISHDNEEENIDISTANPVPKKNKIFCRMAGIAAIIVFVLLAGTATAYAAGIDVFGIVAHWSEETFGFMSNTIVEQKEVPPQLESLRDRLDNYTEPSLIPTYFPPGFELENEDFYADSVMQKITCLFSNGENSLTIQYIIHITTDASVQYEMDNVEPEILEVDKTKIYIFPNVDYFTAVWLNGNIEGSIIINSKEELMKIVESLK